MVAPNRLNDFFTKLGFFLVLVLIASILLRQTLFESLFFFLSYTWAILFFIKIMPTLKISNVSISAFLLLFLAFIHVFGATTSHSFVYYNKFLMLTVFVLLSLVSVSICINKNVLKTILIINILISILYTLFYRNGFSLTHDGYFLTLNFNNPNLAGLFLANTFMYLYIYAISYKELYLSRVTLCLLIFLLLSVGFFIYLTGCRSALMTIIAFILLLVFDKLLKFKLNKFLILLWTILPILFVVLYVAFDGNFLSDSSFVDVEHGKTSTSRMSVWKPALDAISDNFLFGNYSNLNQAIGYTQMHNIHLDVFASYGFFPFVCFLFFLFSVVSYTKQNVRSKFNLYSLYAFMCCFILGTFEAALILGSDGIFILSCGFLLLAHSNTNYNVNLQRQSPVDNRRYR